MYVAFDQERLIALCTLKFNSVGLESDCIHVAEYEAEWKSINEIEIMNQSLIVSHNNGISLVNLESKAVTSILSDYKPKCLSVYKDGFLFTHQQCIYYWNGGAIGVFAGKKTDNM